VQLNPDNADAHFNLAVLLGPRNQLDEAIADLRRVIEINLGTLTRIAISLSASAFRVNSRRRSGTTRPASAFSPIRPQLGAPECAPESLWKACNELIRTSLVAQRCGTSLDTTDNCPYYWGLRS